MFGGVERILETLARESGPPMTSAFALCFEGRLSESLAQSGATVALLGDVRVSRPWQVRRVRLELRSLLDQAGPAVVVVHSSWSQAIFGPAVRRAGRRLVRWLHAPESGASWLERAAALSPPDLVICNSHYTCAASRGRYAGVPREVCYAPVSVEAASGGASRAGLRASLNTPLDAVVIVMAARMEGWKGHHALIDALALINRDLPWRCWIAGGAQRPVEVAYVDALSAHVSRAGLSDRVSFLGERRDMADVLRAADIYCQPNEGAEPFGLTFVEALAAGLPVVATNLGAVGEIVDDTCAVLVPAGAPEPLAAALLQVVGDETGRKAMSAAARARATIFTDVRASIQAIADVIGQDSRSTLGLQADAPVKPPA